MDDRAHSDAVKGEAALGIVKKTEMLVSLLDGDNIHEASGVLHVGADPAWAFHQLMHLGQGKARQFNHVLHTHACKYLLSVDLDVPALQDNLGLLVGHGVLEPVPDQEHDWDALPELVGTGGRTRSELSRKFVKHPVLGR